MMCNVKTTFLKGLRGYLQDNKIICTTEQLNFPPKSLSVLLTVIVMSMCAKPTPFFANPDLRASLKLQLH